MKKFITTLSILLIMPTATAGEVPGTRVSGDVAINCPANSGRGFEMNATTKETWSYCVELIKPSQEQIMDKAKHEIAQTITNIKNATPVKIVAAETVINEKITIAEPLKKLEVNVVTQVVTVTQFTETETAKHIKNMEITVAQNKARNNAEELALNDIGVEHCVLWESNGITGQECSMQPVLATDTEVDEMVLFLTELFKGFEWAWALWQ